MRLVTQLQLRTRVRRRCDIESEVARFPDLELNDYINEGLAQLQVELIKMRGQGYLETSSTITTVSNQELYALPTTFLELTKVFYLQDGRERVLRIYEQFETDGLVEPRVWDWVSDPGYRIVGDSISFRPRPQGIYTVTINFIPASRTLISDSDTFDGLDGFEEFVVCWASKLVAIKQGDDQRMAMASQLAGEAKQRLEAIQGDRNAAEAPHMVDVRGDKWWLGGRRGFGRRRFPLP